MQKWLRITLYSVAAILPLGLLVIITKRFFTPNSSKQRSLSYNSTNNRPVSNTSSRISPQVVHNYTPSIVELTIDQSKIGFIIGRGGERIKRIQNEADVRIRFRDQVTATPSLSSDNIGQSSDRIVVISGRPECAQLAKNMIEKMLQEKIRDEQAMEVRLLIPDWICGRVIGQRGQSIKSLQKLSGAKINIENVPENVRRGESRGCIIIGTPEQIRLANELIENIVQGETLARTQRRQNPRNQFRNQRNSSSEYLTSPTTKNQPSRMHYGAIHDLRRDSEQIVPPKVTLLSREESVYLVYFSQQVQSYLQPLPIDQDYFTAFVSTVNRSGCVWIQLLDGVETELNEFIEIMNAHYSTLVSNVKEDEIEKKDLSEEFLDTHLKIGIEGEDLMRESDSESDSSKPEKSETFDTAQYESDTATSLPQSPIDPILTKTENLVEHAIPQNNTTFKTGMLVAAAHSADDKFYRGIICRIDITECEAHVYFLDFGDDEFCKLTRLHPLKQEFLTLPFQAVLCQLANIEVNSKGLSDRAFSRLQDLTYCAQWKRIFVHASNSDQNKSLATNCIRQCPKINLIDTNGPKDVDINATLIEEQLVNKAEYQHSFT